jgi:hypothetical protein
MSAEKLSPLMEAAIRNAAADGTICGAQVRTELALIRRGLAVAVYGEAEVPNRYISGYGTRTVRNAYLGARLIKRG